MSWPSCRYGPGGASQVFDREEDVPAGWEDHPCKVGLVHKSGMRKLEGDELEAAKQAIENAQEQIAKFDHDHDGRVGGSLKKAVAGAVKRLKKAVKHGDPK